MTIILVSNLLTHYTSCLATNSFRIQLLAYLWKLA